MELVGTATACPGLFLDGLELLNDDACCRGFTLLVDPPNEAWRGREWDVPGREPVVAF